MGEAKPIALIVEDDAELRDALVAVVEHAGFEAAPAGDGLDALRYLAQCDRLPSVVLLDLMMPVLDGWEFLELRDERSRHIPVVVVTGAPASRLPLAYPLLRKPVSFEALLSALQPLWAPALEPAGARSMS